MNTSEKIKDIRNALGVTQSQFAIALGYKQSYISGIERGTKESSRELAQKLLEIYQVDLNWFLSSSAEDPVFLSDDHPIRSDSYGVPYYSIEAMAHISEAGEVLEQTPEYYISFKPFDDCTAWLPVYGDSMVPVIHSGEIIAVKRLMNLDVLLWGEPYLIVTNDLANNLRTVKLVFQHPDASCIILRASNPEFAGDTVIQKAAITALFLVKGKISRRQL